MPDKRSVFSTFVIDTGDRPQSQAHPQYVPFFPFFGETGKAIYRYENKVLTDLNFSGFVVLFRGADIDLAPDVEEGIREGAGVRQVTQQGRVIEVDAQVIRNRSRNAAHAPVNDILVGYYITHAIT